MSNDLIQKNAELGRFLFCERYTLQPVKNSMYIAEGQDLKRGAVVDVNGYLIGTEGLQPYAVLENDCDTRYGGKQASVFIKGEFNFDKLFFADGLSKEQIDNIVYNGSKVGIVIKPYNYSLDFSPKSDEYENVIPEDASEENKLATDADVAEVQSKVNTIDGVIPSGTSTTNKLVNEDGLQTAIDEASESWSTGFTPKGESSVSDLNDLTTQSNGDSYIVTDSGTLTDGTLAVVAGDQVAWDATNSVWYKLPLSALISAVDNISVSIATKFVPNSTTTVAWQPYMYGDKLYVAKEDGYQGPWNASKFVEKSVFDLAYNIFAETKTPANSVLYEIPTSDDKGNFVKTNVFDLVVPIPANDSQWLNKDACIIIGGYLNNKKLVYDNVFTKTAIFRVKGGYRYTFSCPKTYNRFDVYAYESMPDNTDTATVYIGTKTIIGDRAVWTLDVPKTHSYIAIYFYNVNLDSSTPYEILGTIGVSSNGYTDYSPYSFGYLDFKSYNEDIEERVVTLENEMTDVQNEVAQLAESAMLDQVIDTVNAVKYIPKIKLYLDVNVFDISELTYDSTYWSVDSGAGEISFLGGSTSSPLVLDINLTNNGKYLFQASVINRVSLEDMLNISIGDGNLLDTYNGTTNLFAGALSDGGKLKLWPRASSNTFTIGSVSMRKKVAQGSEDTSVELTVDNVNNGNDAQSNCNSFWNVAIGPTSQTQCNAVSLTRSIAIGTNAQRQLVEGLQNIAIGTYALNFARSANRNVAIGSDCNYTITHPNDCISIGKGALSNKSWPVSWDNSATHIHADGLICIGTFTGRPTPGQTVEESVYIGHYCATNGIGNHSVVIGARATNNYQKDNVIVIGYGAAPDKNDQTVIGNTSTKETKVYGDLIIEGTDHVKRKIVFNNDNTCSWEVVS